MRNRCLHVQPLTLLMLLMPLAGAAAGLAQTGRPVVLRYRYKPGSTVRYKTTEEIAITRQAGSLPAVEQAKQVSTSITERRVVSASAEQAVVSETPRDMSTVITTPQGTTTQTAQAKGRIFTMTRLGKVLKVERQGGTSAPGAHEPFENLSFSLPEQAVVPGATWPETVHTYGLDGHPLPLQAKSTYIRNVSHGGHPCAEIRVAFSGSFTAKAAGSGSPANGSISGFLTYWFATDLGIETETGASMRISVTGPGSSQDKAAQVTAVQQFRMRQTLIP